MTLFGRTARLFHWIERQIAPLHRKEWLWRNRNREVVVQSRLRDGEWEFYKAHDPERQTIREDDHRYTRMPLKESREHGVPLCGSCFYETSCRPHPY